MSWVDYGKRLAKDGVDYGKSLTNEGKKTGKASMEKGMVFLDQVGVRMNGYAHKMGSEAFWPVTGDGADEIQKCLRILKTFTSEAGMDQYQPPPELVSDDKKDKKDKKKKDKKKSKEQKVLVKIPREAIRKCKGLAIYTSMRSGTTPMSGSGGGGIVVEHKEDGTWSAPAFITPNNFAAGFMFGFDIYDAVLVIRTEEALKSFYGHKFTLGGTLGVAAGPNGAGFMLESGVERAPVWSYVKSKGFYIGAEITGTVVVSRTDEMALFYRWEGIKAKDVLSQKVFYPPEALDLLSYLHYLDGRPMPNYLQYVPYKNDPEDDGNDRKNSSTSLPLPPPPPIRPGSSSSSSLSVPTTGPPYNSQPSTPGPIPNFTAPPHHPNVSASAIPPRLPLNSEAPPPPYSPAPPSSSTSSYGPSTTSQPTTATTSFTTPSGGSTSSSYFPPDNKH